MENENMKNIHQTAIESVAQSVSSDPDICSLVNKFRTALGMSSKSPKDILSILFEDEVLGQLLKAAVEKKVRFLTARQKFNNNNNTNNQNNNNNNNGNNKNKSLTNKKNTNDNKAGSRKSLKIDIEKLEHPTKEVVNLEDSDDNVVDGLISPNSVGTPREHDLEETHYDDDFDDVSFGSDSVTKRKVSFSNNIEVQVIPRLAEERIDECFYSEEEINQMYAESEQDLADSSNNKDGVDEEIVV